MSDRRPRSSLVVDVLAYALARLLLVVVLTAVIFGAGHLLGVRDFPLVVALLFALVIALPLGIWIFAPLRRRATASIAVCRRTSTQRPRAAAGQAAWRRDSRRKTNSMTAARRGRHSGPNSSAPTDFSIRRRTGCHPGSWSTPCRTASQVAGGTMEVPLFDETVRAGRERLRRADRRARRLGGDGRHRVGPARIWSPPRFPTAPGCHAGG